MDIRKIIKEETDQFLSSLKDGLNIVFLPENNDEKHRYFLKLESLNFKSDDYLSAKDYDTRIRCTSWFDDPERSHWVNRIGCIYVQMPGKIVTGYDSFKSFGELLSHYDRFYRKNYDNEELDKFWNANYVNWDGVDLNDDVDDFGWMINPGNNRLRESEKDDLDWMFGPVTVRFGDIKNNFSKYVSIGDTVYLSGLLLLNFDGRPANRNNSFFLDMEPVVVTEPTNKSRTDKLGMRFDKSVTDSVFWRQYMDSDRVDLGGVPDDDDIVITISTKNQIKESEEDDLDWIRDTEPIDLKKGKWIIHNDVSLTPEEDRKLQEFLYSKGFKWGSDLTIDEMADGDTDYIFRDGYNFINAYSMWNHYLEDMIKNRGYVLYEWSMIKNHFNLDESMNESEEDDLDWIREVPRDLTVTKDNYYVGARVVLKQSSDYRYQSDVPGKIGEYFDDRTNEFDFPSNVWVGVTWDNGDDSYIYRIGPNAFDLDFYFEPNVDN